MTQHLEPDSSFRTTHWSIVARAGDSDPNLARAALSDLCQTYWKPLYAYCRGWGRDTATAKDLTQGFFLRFIERQDWRDADRSRGRFRTFLLACLRHYLLDERRRAEAKKRGGGRQELSLDDAFCERGVLSFEPSMDPERAFQKAWAYSVLETILVQLEEDYARRGKSELFRVLRPGLTGGLADVSSHQIAEQLAMSPGAVRVAQTRLRDRFRQGLCQHLLATLEDPADLDSELEALFGAVAQRG